MKGQIGALLMGKKVLVGITFGAIFMDLLLMARALNKRAVGAVGEILTQIHLIIIYLSTMVFHPIHMKRYIDCVLPIHVNENY